MILPNVEIKKILYATDLSESAIHAFAYAVSLANLYNAGITILHVLYDDPNKNAMIQNMLRKDQWEEIKKRHYEEARNQFIGKKRENVAIKEVIHTFAENVRKEADNQDFMTDEILIERGIAEDKILAVAEKMNCDIIVMGSHGHKGIVEAMLGSTARRVVRRSQKPVLVIKLPE
jgi:nucleotide-binding universal stress UspA family protein